MPLHQGVCELPSEDRELVVIQGDYAALAGAPVCDDEFKSVCVDDRSELDEPGTGHSQHQIMRTEYRPWRQFSKELVGIQPVKQWSRACETGTYL
jgi:hypothetical protein